MFGLARLGRDCEVRYTQGGKAVAGLALAFNYGKKADDGKRPTQWVEGTIWGERAESLKPYLLKGGLVSVTLNDVHIETYQGRSGEGHKLVGIVAEIEPAGGGQQPQQRQNQQSANKPGRGRTDDGGDEIPF